MGAEGYANVNDAKNFCEALKDANGLARFSLHHVRSIDRGLIKNKGMIHTRWAECQQNLPNKVHATDSGFQDDL